MASFSGESISVWNSPPFSGEMYDLQLNLAQKSVSEGLKT